MGLVLGGRARVGGGQLARSRCRGAGFVPSGWLGKLGKLFKWGDRAGDAAGGISRGGKYLFETWHRGTFPNRLQSIQYHLTKHGAGRTAVEYTEDAMRFFDEYSHLGKPVTLMDGTPGIRLQVKLPDPSGGPRSLGGYWTDSGRLVTFWD